MVITLTKEELIRLLKSQEAKALKEDAATAKAHERDEKAALEKFRAKLRDALKWDYETAKKKARSYDTRIEMSSPSCPTREAPRFARMIRSVELDMRKSPYQIKHNSDIGEALAWFPKSERPAETVCG